MSDPRFIAEDVVRYYLSALNPNASHSANVYRHLRNAVLAVTKHILFPQGQHHEVNNDGEYLNRDQGLPCEPIRRGRFDWSVHLIETSPSFDSDQSEEEKEKNGNDNFTNTGKVLTVRSMARMEAFLGSCALSLPNDPILHAVGDSNTVKAKSLVSNLRRKLKSSSVRDHTNAVAGRRGGTEESKSNLQIDDNINAASALSTALSGYSITNDDDSRKTKKKIKKKKNQHRYPQIHAQDLTLAIELYILTLHRIHKHQLECVLHLEPPRNLISRVRTLLTSFVSTAGTVGSVRLTLTKLLTCLTRELLAVESLSSELESSLRRIVLEYEHVTSFASLAFLSSPNESAETNLFPLVMGYVEYLKRESDWCVEQCKLEFVLSGAMDSAVRKLFKTATFKSIGHLLEVCRENSEHLENVIIRPLGLHFEMGKFSLKSVASNLSGDTQYSSPTAILHTYDFHDNAASSSINSTKAIKQAVRDLCREVITVNGHILPPVHSLKELVKLLRETLNSRPLKLKEKFIGNGKRNRLRRNKNPAPTTSVTKESDSDLSDSVTGLTSASDSDFISSGNEGDIDGGHPTRADEASSSNGVQSLRTSKRRIFDLNAIDIMTRRLLIAASRTGAGGNAYFVVRDLFGGEDVEVVSSEPSIPYGQMPRCVSDCTIELIVRLASVVIKCHGRFDVYPKELVRECEPLIQLHTTSIETIQLHEIRADSPLLQQTLQVKTEKEDVNNPTVLVLQEKKTEMTGCITVAIHPARYERVENWKTPS